MPAPVLASLPPRIRDRSAPAANATLIGCESLTDEVRVLRVRRDDGPLAFAPGQYVSLGLWHDGGWLQRPYSPASAMADGEVELLVRRVDRGQLTPLLWATPAGTRLRLGPAKGLFRLSPDDRRTHLLLATGTGIAPLLAMTEALMARPLPPRIVMVHGVRHAADLAYRDRFEAWAADAPWLTYHPTVSRPRVDGSDHGLGRGRAVAVLPDILTGLGLRPASVVAYLCGNPAVVESAASWLASRGLDRSAIRSEEYWPASRVEATT